MRRRILCSMIFVSVLFAFFHSGHSLAAEPYYKGKKVVIVVGYAAGGGFDLVARLLAKHLPNHFPGKPVFIVRNIEGATSMIAANHLYNEAKPDGLTFGTLNSGLPLAQLLKAPGARFDITKFSWIGSPVVEPSILALRTDLPYKTFDDLKTAKEPINIGSTGPASSDYPFTAFLKVYCGYNFKIIVYPSGANIKLALEKKELDGVSGSYTSYLPLMKRGLLRTWVRGPVSAPELNNIPVNEDLTTDNTGKTLMAVLSAIQKPKRPYVAPPGVPADIMKIIKDGFASVTKDPKFIEDAEKLDLQVEYITGDECLKLVKKVVEQPASIVNEFTRYMKFG